MRNLVNMVSKDGVKGVYKGVLESKIEWGRNCECKLSIASDSELFHSLQRLIVAIRLTPIRQSAFTNMS